MTPAPELPATGFPTVILVVLGLLLIFAGYCLYRAGRLLNGSEK